MDTAETPRPRGLTDMSRWGKFNGYRVTKKRHGITIERYFSARANGNSMPRARAQAIRALKWLNNKLADANTDQRVAALEKTFRTQTF